MSTGNGYLVSSTPIADKAVSEVLNISWPSPLEVGQQKDLELSAKFTEEKTQQWLESQKLASQTAGASSEKLKPNVTKLAVIEDTDDDEEEEEEEIRVPLENVKSLKPLVNKRLSTKGKKLQVLLSKNNKQRKEAVDQRYKAVIEDTDEEGKRIRVPLKNIKNVKPLLANKSKSIKGQKLQVSFRKNNKQRKEAVDQRSKEEIEDIDEEEEELRVPLKNVKNLLAHKRRSIKRQELPISLSKNKKQKKEAVDQRIKDAANGQKKTQRRLEPLFEIREECEHDIIKDQRQTPVSTQNEYSQRNKNDARTKKRNKEAVELDQETDPKRKRNIVTVLTTVTEDRQNGENEKDQRLTPVRTQNEYSQRNKDDAHTKKQNKEAVELDHEIYPKQKRNIVTVHSTVTEDRQNEENENERILIDEQQQEKQSLRQISSGRMNLSQQHSMNKSTDAANIQDITPETNTRLPADAKNTDDDDDDDRRAQKSRKQPSQESQSVEDKDSEKELHTSTGSKKRSLYSHEKASFIISEVSVNRNPSKKHSYSYPFLDELDSILEDGANVQGRKSSVRARKYSKRAKKSNNVKKTKIPSKTTKSSLKGKRQSDPTEEGAVDLRRSKRTRVKPIAYWIGERLCYKPGPDLCLEIVGIEPPTNAESIHRHQKNTNSERIAFSIPLQNEENPELKMVEITNKGRKEQVECFSTLRPRSAAEGFSKYRMLDSAATEAGLLKLASSTKKNFKASPAHYVFFILKGHALVQVHNVTQEVKPGEFFQVPKGVSYSIKNLSEKEMVLNFVRIK